MSDDATIAKIVKYAGKVAKYCEGIADQDDFISNTMLVEACVFNLGQIGELANKLDDTVTTAYPEVPWHALYGLRNCIMHDYEGVNLSLVWEIIHDDLPDLVAKLSAL